MATFAIRLLSCSAWRYISRCCYFCFELCLASLAYIPYGCGALLRQVCTIIVVIVFIPHISVIASWKVGFTLPFPFLLHLFRTFQILRYYLLYILSPMILYPMKHFIFSMALPCCFMRITGDITLISCYFNCILSRSFVSFNVGQTSRENGDINNLKLSNEVVAAVIKSIQTDALDNLTEIDRQYLVQHS